MLDVLGTVVSKAGALERTWLQLHWLMAFLVPTTKCLLSTKCSIKRVFTVRLIVGSFMQYLFLKRLLLLCWAGVHCGICTGSYNVSDISHLNSPPPLLSFITPPPHSWNSFNRYHFCICIHAYTVFAQYSLSYPLSWLPVPLTGANPPLPHPHRTCSALLFFDFVEEKR
jgi:hypothetical protein